MNKLYSVHDHWTDINKKNDVDIESINGVITGIKVNGEDYSSTSWTEVFSGDVVTSGEAAPFSGIFNAVLSRADTIKVFYNDGVYILPKQVTVDGIFYGANPSGYPDNIDFSEIPFLIKMGEVNTGLYTQSPGTQNITILEPQSGGGESDFSTAMVSIKSNATNEIICNLAIAQEADPPFIEHSLTISKHYLYENDEYTDRAILYKGRCELSVQNANSINGSGSVDVLNNTTAIITGDCTVTFS